ncbi:MAG: pyruvate, phosphate dikinase [Defluviitaleaceae bacterium]|nr:pyruvate, phosphate dikinase [Defluviitaleaceae bacterium]
MAHKYVYMFKEGDQTMRNLLGGKGANLAQMTKMGIPVPNGFIVTTEACTLYNSSGKVMSADIKKQIDDCIAQLEASSGKKFGDPSNPLLVSVRSGARASMPGMMDTVLNLGISDTVADGLAKKTGNDSFAYDSYRRFIMMYADVVIGVSKHDFEHALDKYKADKGYKSDENMTAADWKAIAELFKKIYRDDQGKDFTTDAKEQLYGAITSVFESWDNERAFAYRRMHDIPYEWGTAVNIQEMVFGNMGETSGTGVVFTRNPASGDNAIYGEYLMNAQGEDVVAGVRTPKDFLELEKDSPACYKEFIDIARKLEKHYKYIQDMEFTIENGKLYILQTRNGKCTAQAALKFAIDLVAEGVVTKEEAIQQVDPRALDQLLHPMFDAKALAAGKVIGKALPASPGAAAGKVYFEAKDAVVAKERGERVILVRLETSPDDILGMEVSQGILTARGGNTSHAAVVARGMGTCCVSGCEEIKFGNKEFSLGGMTFKEGDFISLDGSTGKIYAGDIPTVPAEIAGNFGTFMSWVENIPGKMAVRANADSPKDATKALEFGATGIGLCRTEHMFFDADRIPKMRKMILADTEAERRAALDELLPFQKKDFVGIYEVMKDLPVTIRLLDPPLHEFMPTKEEDFASLAKDMGKTPLQVKERADSLHELNPMMGHRGCRLAVSYPEIAEMQTRAIIEAALEVKKSKGYDIKPEIMIPLVGDLKETRFVKDIIEKKAEELVKAAGVALSYQIGTMIEIPRACLIADDIAGVAEFFSFGTNDLTQMTYGLSRDDAGRILKDYIDNNIYEGDPTARLDQVGVGQLMKTAIEKGRGAKKNLKIGICGEHGGEPSSIGFCHKIGLDYVSCSPFRVPIARLSAAQSALAGEKFD